VYNDGLIRLVDSPVDLVGDLFSDPPRLNPGNISIIRTIVTPPSIPADCTAVLPLNCDTAVFSFTRAEYDIVLDGPRVLVTFVPGRAAAVRLDEGTDTLLNIEQLQFSDVTIPVPRPNNTVPGVIGLTQAAATTAILQAGLRVGVVTTANSPTIPIGRVISSSPRPGVTLPPNAPVDLVISLGTITPLVVGLPLGDVNTRGTALSDIDAAGLVVGTIIQQSSNTVPAGVVISQNPADGLTVEVGTAMSLVVSSGRPPVTVLDVVGQTQAAATAALTGQGLTVSVTFSPSTTVAAGRVISQTPTGGSSAAAGSNVALVVSQGTAPTVATFVSRNTMSPNTIITSPAFAVAANTLLVAFVSMDGPDTTPATPAGSRQVVNSMTNSGAALTWQNAARANAQAGDAEVWYAFVPTARASITVNSVFRFSATASMTVVGFTGAANTLAGAATAIASKATGVAGDPTASITTTRANSLVFGVGTDWDSPRRITAGAGQTKLNQSSVAAITDTYWSQRLNAPVPLAGVPTTLSATGTGTDRWNFAVVEIRQP
jgi:beta-lactam-binding protein with PASTA domain